MNKNSINTSNSELEEVFSISDNEGYEFSVTARKGGVEKDVTPLYELPYLIKNIKNLNF